MKPRATVLCLTLLSLVPTPVLAVTLGSGTNINCFPFQCAQGLSTATVYQQVYAASAFDGPIDIDGVSFAFAGGSGALSPSRYTLSVSTSQALVDGLNTTNFAANLGADNRIVFDGFLGPNFDGTALTFTFSSRYAYDPTAGNLLLNFNVSPGVVAGPESFFRANNGDAGGVYSRAHNFGGGFAGHGLQTTFLTGAVPEPASWAMMILGFGLAGSALRQRRHLPAR